MRHTKSVRIGVLLTMGFLEVEAAGVLELVRLVRRAGGAVEAVTVAKGRPGLEGAAGAVWTPRYAVVVRPELEALVIPGGQGMAKAGRDPVLAAWLREAWPALDAVFLGANAAVLLAEAGLAPSAVAAHPRARPALEAQHLRVVEAPIHREGRVVSTRGYAHLLRALAEYLEARGLPAREALVHLDLQ
ncbi:DJ-1/PfpI family protein [Marinithermus hydrothermalis]|uniref:ThiJ/PfpI domain-containing protein n=1 Tax=Marinithermus hydrothermalis (strain DSM 14884 / JCM 11576 / T1) TaxID=869210 RepID=F2NQ31_MARHT|nr:DJ-1/PfpI family protein [Marinithermus hydrothermalis]AEB11132.1 ThiJ/PfpI domain-containing protein [Marinithermus hydrothermalis DSM 14884]